MNFQIVGLDERQFEHLFGASQEVLDKHGIERMTVETRPGYPCRISLEDAAIGETVLLLNYEHLPVASPYRSAHAIFVREGATRAIIPPNEIPEMIRIRLLSVRAFDADGMMVDADIVEGTEVQPMIERMLSLADVDFLHIHNAARGCFIARVDRA